MAKTLNIDELAKEQGINLGPEGSRKSGNTSVIADIIGLFKDKKVDLLFNKLGQMNSSQDKANEGNLFQRLNEQVRSFS